MTVKLIRLRLKHDPSNPKEFKLGLGPCGRTVEALGAHSGPHGITILQTCTDSPYMHNAGIKKADEFHYPSSQVLEWRIYYVDQPEVCAIKEPNE